MVEGLNAGLLIHARRMDSLMAQGLILFFFGILTQLVAYVLSIHYGWFMMGSFNILNGICSIITVMGLAFIAYGVTYSRKGNIALPLAFCIAMLCSADLISWMYFVRLNWTPAPSAIFIIPLAPPGYVPLILTLLFLSLVLLARVNYSLDPRKYGVPKHMR